MQIITLLEFAHKEGANWNSLMHIIKKNGLKYEIKDIEFGLHTSKSAQEAKSEFLSKCPKNEFRAHRYSLAIKARNGYTYNRLFARQIIFK